MVYIPTLVRFQVWPILAKLVLLGILVLFTLTVLWIEVSWIFLSILFSSHTGPLIGWPVMPNWIVAVGWIWTSVTIVFIVFYFYDWVAKR